MARGRTSRVPLRVAALGAVFLILVPAVLGSAVNAGVEDGDPDDKYGVDTTTAETGARPPVSLGRIQWGGERRFCPVAPMGDPAADSAPQLRRGSGAAADDWGPGGGGEGRACYH